MSTITLRKSPVFWFGLTHLSPSDRKHFFFKYPESNIAHSFPRVSEASGPTQGQEGQRGQKQQLPGQLKFSQNFHSTWNYSHFRPIKDVSPIYLYPARFHPLHRFLPNPKSSDIRGMLGRWATCIELVLTQLILPLGTLTSGYINSKLNSPISSAVYFLQTRMLFVLPCWLSAFLFQFLDSTQHFPSGPILSRDSYSTSKTILIDPEAPSHS